MHKQTMIEKSSGDLLSSGYCDFKTDSTYDSLTMEIVDCAPDNPESIRKPTQDPISQYDNGEWVQKPRPVGP